LLSIVFAHYFKHMLGLHSLALMGVGRDNLR